MRKAAINKINELSFDDWVYQNSTCGYKMNPKVATHNLYLRKLALLINIYNITYGREC